MAPGRGLLVASTVVVYASLVAHDADAARRNAAAAAAASAEVRASGARMAVLVPTAAGV